MYRSCLLIDLGDNPDRPRPGRRWLKNRYHVHQRLCMAFPSASREANDVDFLQPFNPDDFGQVHVRRAMDSGFLFSIRSVSFSRAKIIVQSAVEPKWDYAFHNAGCPVPGYHDPGFHFLLAAPPVVKPFDPRFSRDLLLRFSLTANPTRRLSKNSEDAKEASIGKRVPISKDRLIDWLARRGKSSGFIIGDKTTFALEYIYMGKNAKWQRLRSVSFDGVLQVTDPDIFCQEVVRGIGSGKAFGFGLFLLAPANLADFWKAYESSGSTHSPQV